MISCTITVEERVGKGLAVNVVPTDPSLGTDKERAICRCLDAVIWKTLEIVAVKAGKGEAFSTSYFDGGEFKEKLDKMLEDFRTK